MTTLIAFLLEEYLSSINLCTLHCKLRNTEQLLSSLGLFSYKVGSLDECNAELANYGPKNFSSRITVKMKEGQETAVEKAQHPGVFIFRYLLSSSFCHDCFHSLFCLISTSGLLLLCCSSCMSFICTLYLDP